MHALPAGALRDWQHDVLLPTLAAGKLTGVEVLETVSQQHRAHRLPGHKRAAAELEQAGLGLGGGFWRDRDQREPAERGGVQVQRMVFQNPGGTYCSWLPGCSSHA